MDNKIVKNINGADAEQSRWRSPVVWSAIFGLIVAVCGAFGIWEKIGITAEEFTKIATAFGALLAAFGVVNNPKSKNKF